MAQGMMAARTYVLVCVLLILLLVLTVALSFVPMMEVWHLVIGLLIAACQASLVALFFMHAAVSPRLTWIVILVTVFWVGIQFVLTLNDYFSRGMIPYTPGH